MENGAARGKKFDIVAGSRGNLRDSQNVSDTLQSSVNLPISERRVQPRQRVLFSCAELDEDNGGIVLNLSEGGLALQAVGELVGDELPKIRFQFSQSPAWIEAKGRITWRSDSKKTAGVKFIDLPAQARKQIQTWISLTSETSGFQEETVPQENPGQPAAATASRESINAIRVSENKIAEPVPENIFSFSRPPPERKMLRRFQSMQRLGMVGPKSCILATNFGSVQNKHRLHPQALLDFMTALHKGGISLADINLRAKTNSALALGLSARLVSDVCMCEDCTS